MHIDIEPLQPPFDQDYVTVEFEQLDHPLAVSVADWKRLCALLGTNEPTHRMMEISACEDGYHLRVTLIAN